MRDDERTREELQEALKLAEEALKLAEEENRRLREALQQQEPLRKRAADALSAVEARYRRLVETADEGVWTLDAAGQTDFINARGAALLGYGVEEILGRPPTDFVFPEDVAAGQEEVEKNRRGHHESQTFRMRRKDGREAWFASNTAPIFAEDGETVVGAFSMFTDVTAHKHAEAERDAHLARLEEALTEVRRLRSILPICSYCKKVRDDRNYWQHLESYITEQTGSQFSHSICPDCLKQHFPDYEV